MAQQDEERRADIIFMGNNQRNLAHPNIHKGQKAEKRHPDGFSL